MRPRTLRRRGQFYRRKRGRWRLNLALVLIGVALAGFVVVDMGAGWPPPGSAERIAAAAPHAPAQTAAAELGSTKLASAASAPVPASPFQPGRPGALVPRLARDARRRALDRGGAPRDAPSVREVNAMERAPVPTALAQRSLTPPERCKTCGDDVPF